MDLSENNLNLLLVLRSIYQSLIFNGFSIELPEIPVGRAACLTPFHRATECRLPNAHSSDRKRLFFVLFCFRRPERPETNRTDGRACFVLNNYRYDLRVKKRTCARGPPGPACVIEILIVRSVVGRGNRSEHNRLRCVHRGVYRGPFRYKACCRRTSGDAAGEKIERDPRLSPRRTGPVVMDPGT